jgi:hypothetical protein
LKSNHANCRHKLNNFISSKTKRFKFLLKDKRNLNEILKKFQQNISTNQANLFNKLSNYYSPLFNLQFRNQFFTEFRKEFRFVDSLGKFYEKVGWGLWASIVLVRSNFQFYFQEGFVIARPSLFWYYKYIPLLSHLFILYYLCISRSKASSFKFDQGNILIHFVYCDRRKKPNSRGLAANYEDKLIQFINKVFIFISFHDCIFYQTIFFSWISKYKRLFSHRFRKISNPF